MIYVIYGKPGGGKSYFAMMQLEKELTTSNRNIVTNLPIKLPELCEYMQDKYPDKNLLVKQRVQIIPDKELIRFYQYRGNSFPAIDGIYSPGSLWDKDAGVGANGGHYGVAYFLDEAHLYFNARKWAETPEEVLMYFSQHRKLGDNVYPITQAVHKIDKQFRADAQSFVYCKNEYIAKLGVFKGRGRFIARWYDEEPNAWFDKPYETTSYYLDLKGIANTYDTKRGFKVKGNAVGSGRATGGISIYWFIPILFAILAIIVWVIHALPDLLFSLSGHKRAPRDSISKSETETSTPLQKSGSFFGGNSDTKVFLVGYYVKNDYFVGELSDGTFITSKESNISKISEYSVIVDGQKLPLKTSYPDLATPVPSKSPSPSSPLQTAPIKTLDSKL